MPRPTFPEPLETERLLIIKDECLMDLYKGVRFLRMCRLHGHGEYGEPERLKDIVKEIKYRGRIMKLEIYYVGELLVEARMIVGHGNFQQFIADNFEFSYETANNFMNVYKVCFGQPNIVETMKPSVLYQICSPGFPADLRVHIFECGMPLEDIRNNDVKELLRKVKAGELDLESDEAKQYLLENQQLVQSAAAFDRILLCIRDLEKHKHNIATVGGRLHFGYEDMGADAFGQNREEGEKIKEAVQVIDDAIEKLQQLLERFRD